MFEFLFLSALSGAVEIGYLLWGASAWGLAPALLLPIAYQFGNLLCVPSRCGKRSALAGSLVAVMMCLLYIATNIKACAVLAAFFNSYAIQTLRGRLKAECPALAKRTSRIVGFLLAPLMSVLPGAFMLFCASAPIFAAAIGMFTERKAQKSSAAKVKEVDVSVGIAGVMIMHQSHYFVYAYAVCALAAGYTGSAFAAAIIFAVTWLVYIVPQTVAERIGEYNPKKMFFICHGFLCGVMAAMCFGFACDLPVMVLVCWILTGLGGGSVFCIKDLSERRGKISLTKAENLGHVFGVAVSAVTAAVTAAVSYQNVGAATCALSCAFVACTLISAVAILRKETRNSESE